MSPLPFLAWIFGSLVAALVLLLVAPGVLLDHGPFLSYAFTVITAVWLGVDAVHALYEEESEPRTRWTYRRPSPSGQWHEIARVTTTYERGPDGRVRRVRRRSIPAGDRS